MDSRGPERDRIPGSTCGSTCAPRAHQGRGVEVSGCCERKAGGHLAGRVRGTGRLLRTVGARFELWTLAYLCILVHKPRRCVV